jgi:hypothetical protein
MFNSTEKLSKEALVKALCFLITAIALSLSELTKNLAIALRIIPYSL